MPGALLAWLKTRGSGILLHPTSLPGKTGIGTLGHEARRFVDFLASAKVTYWQVCPLGPTGYGDSPYQCFSAFAGNPYLIDLDELKDAGWLVEEDLAPLRQLPSDYVDYGAHWRDRWKILRSAFDRFSQRGSPDQLSDFSRFRRQQKAWLEPYCQFMALKNYFSSISWLEWPEEYRDYSHTKAKIRGLHLIEEISACAFYQYQFFRQWERLKQYASERGVQIFGDIPIFVAMDSSDVWTQPNLFLMDSELRPTGLAGVPPDYFAADGQLWGNPLYDWARHAEEKFGWWMARLRASFELYDVIRIDHFRGFESYCRIPPGAQNARDYRWEPGPGIALFEIVQQTFPHAKLVAEDLGLITDSVKTLMQEAGLPGMKILQFAFEGATEYLPHNAIPNSVLYPGTHDNDTAAGWYAQQPANVRDFFRRYLRVTDENPAWEMVKAGYASASRIFVTPLQDLLGLGSEARMNTPGQAVGNWRWRFDPAQFEYLEREIAPQLRELAELYGR